MGDGPVSGGEMMQEDEHLKLGKLTAWTGVQSIAKGHERVRFRWHLQHHRTYIISFLVYLRHQVIK